MTLDKVHIIGHSLGAHAAGFAGKWIKNKLNNKVRRITGLDPAGPNFEKVNENERLDRNDAEFVDIIHSNMAYSVTKGFGIVKPIGHFDFYPNGGEKQPGCPTLEEAAEALAKDLTKEAAELTIPGFSLYTFVMGEKTDIDKDIDDISCNHGRATQYFIESITSTSCRFIARECSLKDYLAEKCPRVHLGVPMGYQAEQFKMWMDPKASKTFFLSTNSKTPFCKPYGAVEK